MVGNNHQLNSQHCAFSPFSRGRKNWMNALLHPCLGLYCSYIFCKISRKKGKKLPNILIFYFQIQGIYVGIMLF